MPTHFPNGVSNQVKGNPLFNYPYMDPFKYYTYYDDFFEYHAGIYTITTVEAGSGAATEAITSGAGGQLLITNDDADDDNDGILDSKDTFPLVVNTQTQGDAGLEGFAIPEQVKVLETK